MYLTMDKKVLSLRDFVNGNETQGIIRVKNRSFHKTINAYFAIRLKDKNETDIIYINHLSLSNVNGDKEESFEVEKMQFLFAINHEYKYVIHINNWQIDIESELCLGGEYKFYRPEELTLEMEIRYRDRFNTLLEEALLSVRDSKEYKDAYKKEVEKEKEHNYIGWAMKRNLLKGKDSLRKSYKINFFNHYGYRDYEGEKIEFKDNDLELIHKYISIDTFIENLATLNFKADYDVENIAEVDFFNETLEEELANPSELLVVSRKIREAIEDAGKTLNIKTKDGEIVKVKSDFDDGDDFTTVKGYRSIKILDIDEITFSRKVLYKAE